MENQNNTFNDFNELNELRQQINDLKNKVEQQGQLNEELVKKTIQSKMRGVQKTVWKLAILVIAVIPIYIAMKYQVGLSWPLIIFTILLLVGSITSDFFINHIDVSHMGDDLVETANKLIQMKKNRHLGQKIGISVAIIWFIWFCYEYFQVQLAYGQAAAWTSIAMLVVGLVVGGIIGMHIFNKMQRANDEMIEQINELTREQ